jgi:hypothetical protein
VDFIGTIGLGAAEHQPRDTLGQVGRRPRMMTVSLTGNIAPSMSRVSMWCTFNWMKNSRIEPCYKPFMRKNLGLSGYDI